MFGHFGNNAIQLVKIDRFNKSKNQSMMKYKVIYETSDTREENVVKGYLNLISKIKLININSWTLISVKRKF